MSKTMELCVVWESSPVIIRYSVWSSHAIICESVLSSCLSLSLSLSLCARVSAVALFSTSLLRFVRCCCIFFFHRNRCVVVAVVAVVVGRFLLYVFFFADFVIHRIHTCRGRLHLGDMQISIYTCIWA